MEIEEDQVDETMQSSPPKHGQQNLMGMMSATASGPQPQKRIKTIERVDEKGYTGKLVPISFPASIPRLKRSDMPRFVLP